MLLSIAVCWSARAEPPKLNSPEVTSDGVKFSYYDPDAFSLSVAGDFNQWSINAHLMERDKAGVWTAVVPLKPGRYQYQFNVNGIYWKHDPSNTNKVVDNLGGIKSVVEVRAADGSLPSPSSTNSGPVETSFSYVDPGAKKVAVCGFFNGWDPAANVLTNDGHGKWTGSVVLKPGNHGYKFWVDGAWIVDPANPVTVADGYGGSNSVVGIGR